MLYLIAIFVAFFGGLLGRAFAFRSTLHRLVAFFAPVLLCAALIHVPVLTDLLQTGFPPLEWEVLSGWSAFQCATLLGAALVTAIGWFCSYCIQSVFED